MPDHAGAAVPEAASTDFQLASVISRGWAVMLDGFFLAPVTMVLMIPILLPHVQKATSDGPEARFVLPFRDRLLFQAALTAVGVVYFSVLDASVRRGTWGKRVVGLEVTDLEGQRLTWGRAVVRALARWVPGLFGLLIEGTLADGDTPSAAAIAVATVCAIPLLLMPLVTPRRQALHDLLAGSVVIRRRGLGSPERREHAQVNRGPFQR
jgi:uncharacterized RDD family membrane protein YckC